MKRGRHPIAFAMIVFCGICIFLPLVVLVVWSMAAKWAWPDIFPQALSLRALGELFGGYSGAMSALGLLYWLYGAWPPSGHGQIFSLRRSLCAH